MVQTPQAPAESLGRRERNRLARHRSYLRTALRIATEESLDALTMQRLADEVDAAVGTVYTYFPSKGALIAEVQREAIERLAASYLLLWPDLEHRVEDEAPETAALTHLVGFARFSIASMDTFPQEQRLLQALMSRADRAVPDEEAGRVLSAALRLLDLVRDRFAHAAEVRALHQGDAMERTIVLSAALNGVLQLGKLERWDPVLLDGARLGRSLVDDLLVGWGADRAGLAAAHAHVDRVARRQPLARPLPEEVTS